MLNFFFLVTALILMYCGIMTILERNVIHVVLYLITTFVFSSLLLFLAGLEFFGLLFIAIYVGAISIFFLFIVMCLDLSSKRHQYTFTSDKVVLLLLFCIGLYGYFCLIAPIVQNFLDRTSNRLFFFEKGDIFYRFIAVLYEQNYFYLLYFGWFFLVILVGISLVFRK